jgi:hypothetical protein
VEVPVCSFVVMPCPSTSLAKIWARVHGYI